MVPIEIDGEQVRDCDRLAMNIWLREEAGQWIYYSSASGSEVEEHYVDRSPVSYVVQPDASKFPALLLQYDGEIRTTETGSIFQWWLLMPSKDTFTWKATHWPGGATTAVRTRCRTEDAVS